MKNLCTWIIVLLACGNLVSAETSVAGAQAGDNETDERHFDLLSVGALSFTNVWVHRQTNSVILIRHSMGIHSIKLADLPADELLQLKSQVGDLAELPAEEVSGWRSSPFVQKVLNLFGGGSGRTKVILGIVAGLVVLLVAVKIFGGKKTETA